MHYHDDVLIEHLPRHLSERLRINSFSRILIVSSLELVYDNRICREDEDTLVYNHWLRRWHELVRAEATYRLWQWRILNRSVLTSNHISSLWIKNHLFVIHAILRVQRVLQSI